MSKEELYRALQRIEDKISCLSKKDEKPNRHSIKELAKHCNASENTIRNWIKEGKLKADRIGRRIFISEEEFQNALSEVKSLKYKRA